MFNAETFQSYLEQLLSHRTSRRQMIVVLDNARYHHAVLLRPFPHERAPRLQLSSCRLTVRSPPQRAWKLTRRLATRNRYFPTLEQLVEAVSICFDRWRRPNEGLRRLCCIT